jgi:CubicO group peptidase (beta-lactamase class C family)
MTINLKLKNLIVIALLSGFSSVAAKSAEENNGLAPEATAADAELSFRDIPYLKKAFIDAAPTDRKDAISVGELGVDGGNKAMIFKLAQEIADNKHDRFDSLLIAHKGKLLFESYYLKGRINLPHPQASATKSYTSLAIGRAIQLGYLTIADLDKPLVSFLKDLDSTKFVDGSELITLHKAMTMRSGIRISKEQKEEFKKNPSQLKGQGQVQAYLEHSAPITAESQSFLYQGDPKLVMQGIEAVVPGTAKDFIKNELLDKMGITNYSWRTDVSGLPKPGSGLSMTSRAMVKWGTLVINKGRWQGEQLIPAAFIDRATSKIAEPSDDEVVPAAGVSGTSYGYFFWLNDLSTGDKSYLSKSADGGGGQYVIVIDELDLVVVVTAHNKSFHADTLSLTARIILPAFIR